LEELAEVGAVDELHEEEVEAAGLTEVVDGDDVGMIEGREGVGLFFEAQGEFRVEGAFGSEEFEGDDPVEGALACLVDDAHAAPAEAGEDFEVREVAGQLLVRERFGGVGGGFGGLENLGEETAGAEPARGAGGERLVAARTLDGGGRFGSRLGHTGY
jgi:hypothetical protein